jgi:5-deoxy-D-glucuronate isomerase
MKATISAIALFIGGACSERPSDQEAVMLLLESAVDLLAGAKALDEYSRNYAVRPDGKVIGIYVTPQPAAGLEGENSCEVMLEDLSSRPCTKAERAEVVNQDKAMAAMLGQADQSRWFDDYLDLPVVLDGGCNLIEIIFDPQSQRIESTRCNGEA